MKHVLILVTLFTITLSITSCQSERDIKEDATHEQSRDVLAEAIAKLLVDQVITNEQSQKITDEYIKVSGDSAELGLRFAHNIYDLSQIDNVTPEEFAEKLSVLMGESLEPIDYSELEYHLPRSDYYYEIKITDIKTDLAAGAYERREDEYSVPVPVDGYLLSIHFDMTNPYDKAMVAPIPNYATITSTNKEYFSSSTTNHRGCQCKIDNTTRITNESGQELWEFAKLECAHRKHCMQFAANETKSFIIHFKDPVISDVRKLVFRSFNLSWQEYNGASKREKGLVIDVDKGKVIGEKKY